MQWVDITLSHSQETLRRVKENDETLIYLWIGGTVRNYKSSRQNNRPTLCIQNTRKMLSGHEGVFNPSDESEFSGLGAYIGENTHLTKLVQIDGRTGLDVECLRSNSSIHKLSIASGGHDI